jgi:hypothetical protein
MRTPSNFRSTNLHKLKEDVVRNKRRKSPRKIFHAAENRAKVCVANSVRPLLIFNKVPRRDRKKTAFFQ